MTSLLEKFEYEPLPLLIIIAFHQWLARLSLYFPFQREKALAVIFGALLLPLVLAILCWLLVGTWLVGVPWLGVWLAMIAFALWKARVHRNSFQPVHPDTMREFQFRQGQARIKRTRRHDAYLPPGIAPSVQPRALLLIPDHGCDRMSYVRVASQLSDKGILVFVLNTEPYRVPSTLTGCGEREIANILKEAQEQHGTITDWAIGGHGKGALPASLLVEKLGMSKLLVWGVMSTMAVDLSHSKVEVLVLMTEAVQSKEELDKIRLLFPPEAKEAPEDSGNAVYTMIQGDFDSEQQEPCARVTASFMLHG